MKKDKYPYIFSIGYASSDMNQGTLSAILPFLIAAYHYDYGTAALLVMVANIVGSIVQPLFGTMADRKNIPWIMSLGLVLAGGGMAAAGFARSFPVLCICVMTSGIGVAMFHLQAAMLVGKASDPKRKGTSISIFSFGGSVGFTLGPVILTAGIRQWGLRGAAVILIPVYTGALLLLCFNNAFRAIGDLSDRTEATTSGGEEALQNDWGSFAKLTVVVFARSTVFYGMNTFLSLYFIRVLGQSEEAGNAVLSAFYAVHAITTLFVGRLADRWGCKNVIIVSCALMSPFLFLLAHAHTPVLALFALLPVGIGIGACYSPMVVLGQEYLPNSKGLASGVTLGLAVSVGGIMAPLLGRIGDAFGLRAAMLVIFAISLIPLAASFVLSERNAASSSSLP